MTPERSHISVCICTYKRPELLERLLEELSKQETGGLFTYSIVVADNDQMRSAEPVVTEFATKSQVAIKYCNEPRQGIALARNKVVANAEGEFLAFIDDDEFPIQSWLLNLFETCSKYSADGALGPVKPHFDGSVPPWVIKSKIYDRPSHATGSVLNSRQTRSGNVLIKREVPASEAQPFRPEFRSGEDVDFFRRMIEKGHRFVWCEEAVAYEVVPQARWKRSYMCRRALLRGACSVLQSTFGIREVVKSIVAIPLYTLALPIAFLAGQDKFMPLMVSLCDHVGRMLALLGINPVRESYVTD